MLTAITTALSALVGGFNRYQERKQAEHAVRIAKLEAEKELSKEVIRTGLELGTIQVRATGKWFKYLTFVLWFGPFFISTFWPEYAAQIFKNWQVMPEWYSQALIVILFAIWGIQAGKESIANIFSGLGKYFDNRRRTGINRKLFYDVLRSTKGNITQAEVELYEKALDRIQGDKGEK